MPSSQRPRKPYSGSRALRDLQAASRPVRAPGASRTSPVSQQIIRTVSEGIAPSNPQPRMPHAPAPVTARSIGRLSRRRLAGVGAGAAVAGGGAYAAHRRRNRVRKGDDMLLRDPFSGDLLEVSKAYPIALPVQSSTPVTPLHPSGPHVSRVNDLKRFRRRSKMPPDSRVQVFHSGSQTQMKGGGAAFGRRASRVTKSDSLRQPIVGGGADKGYRGSPLSELGRHNRHGTRIPR